jgi:hypothetical protein
MYVCVLVEGDAHTQIGTCRQIDKTDRQTDGHTDTDTDTDTPTHLLHHGLLLLSLVRRRGLGDRQLLQQHRNVRPARPARTIAGIKGRGIADIKVGDDRAGLVDV